MLSRLLTEPFALAFMQRALAEVLLLGALAGAVSVFVLLRRLAFVSDAFTHTVFPGVVIGHLLAGESGIAPGALIFALLSAVLFTGIAANRRVSQDAALAILLTSFFAVGVVFVSRQRSYTADLAGFLFGRILSVDTAEIVQTAAVGLIVSVVLLGLRKELLLRAFDPDAARAMGYRIRQLDLALNLSVALVIVAAVQAVGTLLVIALLVVPAAAARLLSERLAVVTGLAVAFGMLSGWLGLVVSYEASINHGVRLASGATVVLALVTLYVLALGIAAVRRSVRRRRHAWRDRPSAEFADAGEHAAAQLATATRPVVLRD